MNKPNAPESTVEQEKTPAAPSMRQMKIAFNVLLGLILLFAAIIFMMILVKLPGAF
ncbi:MAG: hypothetical protein RL180_1259 [Pseudomonadota bacterium]